MTENEKKRFDSEETKRQDQKVGFIKDASQKFFHGKQLSDELEKERVLERAVLTGRPPKGKGEK